MRCPIFIILSKLAAILENADWCQLSPKIIWSFDKNWRTTKLILHYNWQKIRILYHKILQLHTNENFNSHCQVKKLKTSHCTVHSVVADSPRARMRGLKALNIHGPIRAIFCNHADIKWWCYLLGSKAVPEFCII